MTAEALAQEAADIFVESVRLAEKKFPHRVLAALFVYTHVFLETNHPEVADEVRNANDKFLDKLKKEIDAAR